MDKKKKCRTTFLTFPDLFIQWLSKWHKSAVAWIWRSKGGKKCWRLICFLTLSLCDCILLPHFDADNDEVYSTDRHSWHWWVYLHNYSHKVFFIIILNLPSLFAAAVNYSWDWDLLSMRRLQTLKRRFCICTLNRQVMTSHVLRWMAITVHQCQTDSIQKMTEDNEDMNI